MQNTYQCTSPHEKTVVDKNCCYIAVELAIGINKIKKHFSLYTGNIHFIKTQKASSCTIIELV